MTPAKLEQFKKKQFSILRIPRHVIFATKPTMAYEKYTQLEVFSEIFLEVHPHLFIFKVDKYIHHLLSSK